jgi:hypothetical protein
MINSVSNSDLGLCHLNTTQRENIQNCRIFLANILESISLIMDQELLESEKMKNSDNACAILIQLCESQIPATVFPLPHVHSVIQLYFHVYKSWVAIKSSLLRLPEGWLFFSRRRSVRVFFIVFCRHLCLLARQEVTVCPERTYRICLYLRGRVAKEEVRHEYHQAQKKFYYAVSFHTSMQATLHLLISHCLIK